MYKAIGVLVLSMLAYYGYAAYTVINAALTIVNRIPAY